MISASILQYLRGSLPEPLPQASDDIAPQDHDLLVRYALIGIFVILATASLSVMKAVAMPVVAGVIFGLVLGPIADWMNRAGLPQGLAAAVVVGAGSLMLFAIVAMFAAPFAIWSDSLPGMVAAMKEKLAWLFQMLKRFENMAGDLSPATSPQIRMAGESPLISIAVNSSSAAGGMLIFIATVFFYLSSKRHLKARILRLCLGRSARHSAGEFFQEIESRVATYFGTVTVINLAVGAAAALIAWLADLPFPLFWGVIAFVLNYVAYFGPIVMSVLFLGAGFIGERTLVGALWPALAFFLVDLVEGNVITPIVVGKRVTVAPFLVFISFVFWLWLWGPVGAILSTPILLVAIVVTEAQKSFRRAEEILHRHPTDPAIVAGPESMAAA